MIILSSGCTGTGAGTGTVLTNGLLILFDFEFVFGFNSGLGLDCVWGFGERTALKEEGRESDSRERDRVTISLKDRK